MDDRIRIGLRPRRVIVCDIPRGTMLNQPGAMFCSLSPSLMRRVAGDDVDELVGVSMRVRGDGIAHADQAARGRTGAAERALGDGILFSQ